MPISEDAKALTKKNILLAAERGFRTGGYGGIGVDGISKDAGVTSGAFYAHYGSKANAFEQALIYGLQCVHAKILSLKHQYGTDSVEHFIDYYFEDQLHTPLSQACALPSLSADVARASANTRKAYEHELAKIANALAASFQGFDEASKHAKAWALLSILIGGSTMVRAVKNEKLAHTIIKSARAQALDLISS
ncbi:MAG TPA: TetR/AcrR family transcriptional regulator [Hellea balneolensis]|uniref:TetR/AcrR family transcriptional regulator n=1 Tax=Hellea balneolensis TaxID=287478 RepID=A0A7C3C6A3_9PROT|nr:TetR/AcrR family transcriptional regulator [Hellea balneolensis]